MKVSRWGNRLALRLPARVVEALKLREGDDVEILVAEGAAWVSPAGRTDRLSSIA